MKNILFVCKSNIGRSQMAEAFFLNETKNDSAFSAGVTVRPEREGESISTITEKVITCMEQEDLEVGDKKMNQLTSEMVEKADKVVVIAPELKSELPEYLKNSSKLECWAIPDAGGSDLIFHNTVRDMIKGAVTKLIKDLS